MLSEDEKRETILTISFLIMVLATSIGLLVVSNSCTLCLQNISTHGEADDVVDDTLTNQPNVSPTLTIPAKVL